MEITAALAADLAILTEALDETDADITKALHQLATDVRLAVDSYLGLTVISGNATFPLTFSAMEKSARPDDVVASLMMLLGNERPGGADVPFAVILYAARPGAFVDLAADLCWLAGRPLSDFPVDQHLSLPAGSESDSILQAWSRINQAIGVLLGRGYTLEQAELAIDACAAAAGNSRSEVAGIILAGLPPSNTPPC